MYCFELFAAVKEHVKAFQFEAFLEVGLDYFFFSVRKYVVSHEISLVISVVVFRL